ncbi:MAG TPA: hypothetical protein V6D50_16200 [Chroococcales cyanobacterium]
MAKKSVSFFLHQGYNCRQMTPLDDRLGAEPENRCFDEIVIAGDRGKSLSWS